MKPGNMTSTVFLTEIEVERIRSTVKERLKKCSEIVGSTREPRDLKESISQATGASLMADMADSLTITDDDQRDTIPVMIIGNPYPPCTLSLQDLQPMQISELKMDVHHGGYHLRVKRVSPVVILATRSWTMVQDEGGEIERLEVCLHKSLHGKDILESTSVYIIKEPYFTLTDQGEATIRIDHPSDLMTDGDKSNHSSLNLSKETSSLSEDLAITEEVARSCKEDGNAALEENNLYLAHARYSEGLEHARKGHKSDMITTLTQDILRNRAYINLLLGRSDQAKADALASLIGGKDQRSIDLDSKAYFRAGCAAYNLGEYHDAMEFFGNQQKLSGNDNLSANVKRVKARLREIETGTYDFKKIRAGQSREHQRVDAASFIKDTEIAVSPGRGNGLFAIRDMSAGDMILCEKAFCVVWGHELEAMTAMTYDVRDDRIRVSPLGLTKSTVQSLLKNPSQIQRVMSLYGDYKGHGKLVTSTEDEPVVDTFRVHDIISRNAFGLGSQYDGDARTASTGLWIQASYINHSCIPNSRREYIGDLMLIYATKPIAAGEEIFSSYNQSSDYDTRQAALMTTWNFVCNCRLCVAEMKDDPVAKEKRRQLEREADAFVDTEHWVGARRLTISKARRLAKAIEDTYDSERFKDIPHIASHKIQEWLKKANKVR
jgi:hypothetical protein